MTWELEGGFQWTFAPSPRIVSHVMTCSQKPHPGYEGYNKSKKDTEQDVGKVARGGEIRGTVD